MLGFATRTRTALALAALLPAMACADDQATERRKTREKARVDLARETGDLEKFSHAFRKVAAVARPSVVHVESRHRIGHVPSDVPEGQGWEEFFRRFFPHRGPAPDGPGVELSAGTGVILDDRGAVLTNDHVV